MKTAMILAAGRGTRLKPMTHALPKSMIKIKGKPLLEHHLIKLSKAGFQRVIINHAYLGSPIRQFVGDGRRWGVEVVYSPEPPGGLETGGGIVNALPLLGDQPFLVVNADIFHQMDYAQLSPSLNKPAHLILVKNKPEFNLMGDFGLNEKNEVTNDDKLYTFSGLSVYHPKVFHATPMGRFSLTPLLRQLAADHEISGEVYDGLWFAIDSFHALEAAKNSVTI